MGKPVKDESERRLKLVSLAYEVLRDMKTPDEATDEEMLSLLSRAFFDKATALMELAPPCMYYTADNARTVALRRSVH